MCRSVKLCIAALLITSLVWFTGTIAAGDATSQIFFNDTDGHAYGLVVTFDRAVDIQEWGEGFSSWSFLEDGTSVLFHEGEIPVWGSFYFFWTPADARVTKLQWLNQPKMGAAISPASDASLPEPFQELVWQQTGGPPGGNVMTVAVDPVMPNILYVGLSDGGIFTSRDRGEHWECAIFKPDSYVGTIAATPQAVFAGANNLGFYRSDDHGLTWREAQVAHETRVSSVYYSPRGGGVLLVSTQDSRIFVSHDDGRVWKDVTGNLPHEGISTVAISGAKEYWVGQSNRVNGGLYHTTDGGRHWERVAFPQPLDTDVSHVLVANDDPNLVFVGLRNVHNTGRPEGHTYSWLTRDGGASWQPIRGFFDPDNSCWPLAQGPDEAIYVNNANHLYRSRDRGRTWEHLPLREGLSGMKTGDFGRMAVDPVDPDVLYVPVLNGVAKSTDGGKSWTVKNEGMILTRISLLTAHPTDPGTVYAASAGGEGTFRSTDYGDHWTWLNGGGLPHPWADELVIDPADPDTIYEIVDIADVYRTTDGGDTWRMINDGFRFASIYALAVDPYDSNTLYAAKNGFGIFKSANGGNGWTYLRGSPDYTYAIAISPSNPKILYAGYNCKPFEETGAIYKSTNGGETWVRKDLRLTHPSQNINNIVIDPFDPGVVYIATMKNGVLKSTDRGDTWKPINTGLRSLDVLSLAIDPTNPKVLYAGLAEGVGVFKSTDGGQTWQEANNGIRIECPSFLQRVGQVSLGVKLEKSPTFISGDYYSIPWTAFTSVAVAPSDPLTVYACDFHHGLYRSRDRGTSWELVNGANDELESFHIRDIAIDPKDPDILYVCSDKGIFKTRDGGASWVQEISGLITKDIHALAIAKSNGALYAGSKGYGVFRFERSWSRWEQASGLREFGVRWPVWDRPMYQYSALLIDSYDPSTLYIGTFPAGIFKSTDGGRTWRDKNLTFTNDGIMFMICHPEQGNVVYAGTYNGVSRSSDGGESWEVISDGIPPEQWVFSIAFDPTDPNIMYACSKNGENMGQGRGGFRGTVVKSIDGGEHWFEITNGLNVDQEFYKIIVDSLDRDTLYLATQGNGVFISEDGGDHWVPWNEGLTNLMAGTNGNNVSNVLAFSADGKVLYFATSGSGVWRRRLDH